MSIYIYIHTYLPSQFVLLQLFQFPFEFVSSIEGEALRQVCGSGEQPVSVEEIPGNSVVTQGIPSPAMVLFVAPSSATSHIRSAECTSEMTQMLNRLLHPRGLSISRV